MSESNSENFIYWDKMKDVPKSALKEIKAGRLKGKSDISPQWRLMIMTEVFGPIGIGWNYKVVEHWTEDYAGETSCYVRIELVYKHNGEWSAPIPGIGGSMILAKESKGPFHSDESYKMATTDALSVAMKQIGVAANIYLGKGDGGNSGDWEGSKNQRNGQSGTPAVAQATEEQIKTLQGVVVSMESAGDIDGANRLDNEIKSGMTASRAAFLVRTLA